MKTCAVGVACLMLLAAQADINGWEHTIASGPRPPKPADTGGDVAGKLKEMPPRTRKSMSSVIGWSPVYDIEKIPLREKDLYRITYDNEGRRADVFIDEFGEVMGEPGLK